MKRIFSVILILTMLICLCSCTKGSDSGTANNGNTSQQSTDRTEEKVNIVKTSAAKAETEIFSNSDFSIKIPKGWKVTTGSTNIYHTIRISDPNEPLNGMFVLLKAECLLHSQTGKEAWQSLYKMGNTQAALYANAPVLSKPSTENFFKIFSEYGNFASKIDSTYAGFTFPKYADFTVTDRFSSNSNLKSYALGDELLRATFSDGGKQGEGLFSASVVDFGSYSISNGNVVGYQLQTVDGGYYMAYNVMAITAVKDTFIEWENLLTECMKTLKYSDSFVSATNRASNEKVSQALKISQNFNQIMDGFMSSWESRNKSTDIISQKQSDATLGYERVYDSETGEIYKAQNGWSDKYDGERYKQVTDDNMYLTPIEGYIE